MVSQLQILFTTVLLSIVFCTNVNAQNDTDAASDRSATRIALQVNEVMNRDLARDQHLVDGWDADHKPVKGVIAISWVPPTEQDNAEIARIGEAAIPTLASYLKLGGKKGGFKQLLAVHFLDVIGTRSTIASLGDALSPSDWQVARLAALSVLGKMPDAEATLLVNSMISDPDPQVSGRAKAIVASRQP